MKTIERLSIRALTTIWLAAATGCVPNPPSPDERTAEIIVVTKFDPAFDFGAASTFAIVPQVSVVSGAIDANRLNPEGGQAIIDRITETMISRGYTQTAREASPDLGINVTALVQIQVAQGVSTGFWWGAPGYQTPPPFWGYPTGAYYTPWTYNTIAYKSGTLLIELVDLRGARARQAAGGGEIGVLQDAAAVGPAADAGDAGGVVPVEVVWAAIMHGTLAIDATSGPQTLSAVDQAFAQSPYLEKR